MTGRIRKREQDPDIARRSRFLLYVAFVAFALLLGRLYWLQVVQSEHFRDLAENNRLRIRTVRAPRGLILDRKGRAIAETQGSYDLVCTPEDVKDLEAEIDLLTEIVEFDADDNAVRGEIRSAKRSNPYSSITEVAKNLGFSDPNWFVRQFRAAHGKPCNKGQRVDERGQNDLACNVELDSAPGCGEVLHASRRAAFLDHAIDNQNCAIGYQAQVAEL